MGWISSWVGMRITTPLKASLFIDSQSGTARLVALSRFLVAIWRARVVLHFDGVVDLHREGGDADFSAVDLDMAVADELSGRGARVGEAKVVDNVVQTRLQDLEHLLAGDAAALEGPLVHAAKLPLHQPVEIAKLLLFQQTHAVVGGLAAGLWAVHARAVITALE